MSNNRIIDLDGNTNPVQIAIGTKVEKGLVEMTFEPAATRIRFQPRDARVFAINLLKCAELAENPPE